MTDDLMKRLTQKDYGDVPIGALDAMSDAADYIEKLEAALREIDEWAEEQCYVGLRKLIRSALEWKKDD